MPRARTAQGYEDEQAALQRQLDGEPDDALRINIPQEPEVDPIVYKDVEPLLFRGFLTSTAEINGILVVFKSLNHHEFELLQFTSGGIKRDAESQFWHIFLSYGVFMFNGSNVLTNRDTWVPKLIEVFAEWPKKSRDLVIRHIAELNRRSANAIRLTECYASEVQSRWRWAQLYGIDLTQPAATGISGTERLGMNWAQLTWRALNYYEDHRDTMEREWDNAKFQGSCSAGKGIQRVFDQDVERRRKAKEDKFARKDAILQHIFNGEPLVEGVAQKYGATLVHAKTNDELAEQMVNDLKGERDWHDFVVDQEERRARDASNERTRQIQERVRENEREFEGQHLRGGTELEGLRPEEVQQRIQRQKTVAAQQAAQRVVHPEMDETYSRFQRKWNLDGDLEIGVGTTDQTVDNVPPIPEQRPRGTPFRR